MPDTPPSSPNTAWSGKCCLKTRRMAASDAWSVSVTCAVEPSTCAVEPSTPSGWLQHFNLTLLPKALWGLTRSVAPFSVITRGLSRASLTCAARQVDSRASYRAPTLLSALMACRAYNVGAFRRGMLCHMEELV